MFWIAVPIIKRRDFTNMVKILMQTRVNNLYSRIKFFDLSKERKI